jgi:hypothetical protein
MHIYTGGCISSSDVMLLHLGCRAPILLAVHASCRLIAGQDLLGEHLVTLHGKIWSLCSCIGLIFALVSMSWWCCMRTCAVICIQLTISACSTKAMHMDLCLICPSAAAAAAAAALSIQQSMLLQLNKAKDKILNR